MRTIMISGLLTVLVISLLCCSKDNNINPDYHSFIAQDKIWSNGFLGYNDSTDQLIPIHSHYIKIVYDTIISEINWCKVYLSEDKNHENWEDWGFIREDSQKIYYMWENDEPKLLYDFSLKTDDEIELRSTTYSVDSVKYLPILNNEIRKHIFLTIKNRSPSGYVVWIESVGSSSGFFENRGNIYIGGLNKLLCCEENGIYLYRDSTFDVCYFDSEK